ncbi:ATP-binding cassette domain-containing protein [uncultured Brachybacterium sp.]|uniref:ATP-binding cassette domain-containing protein n=1 Tax=uncultured Brachybacterium sp. TaxID=189680 RepID=UPI00263375C5|nr:ATP-binding cassette domain-containing protein [uncultured Brachybacterium sp.]
MSTETGTVPLRGHDGERSPGLVIEATDLEVVLPSGDGVGPWTGSIRAGEQVLLLGPSGSGKSTLLRALAGAIPAHQRGRVTGRLRVGGIDPIAGGVLATSAVVGFLGQDPVDGVCLPEVADDVALPLESRCTPPVQIGGRVHRALVEAGIGALGDRAAATLSGGQLQRAGLAAALVARPRLLLLDEPTAMLDAEGVARVRAGVEQAARTGEVAILLVEHRLDDWAGERGTAGLPPRTIALDAAGRVLADGPTGAVLDRHGAALREAGCWLPRELEERLGGGAAAAGPAAATVDAAPLLRVRRADLGPAGRAVLTGVDLPVHAGQLLAVVGRNGAGKSTLLGALSRLDEPLAGVVEGAAAGLAFQRPEAQFVADTVLGELSASGADAVQVTAMLARLGLLEKRDASPFTLSGGQQRRLSLGATLLTQRPVLLADEPGYGLDRAAQGTVLGLLREAADAGRGVVMTTHDLRMVEAADAVAVIADGRLLGPMPPQELLQDPALLRRAGLLDVPEKAATEHPPEPSGAPLTELRSRGPLSRRNPTVLLALLTALSIVCIALTDPLPLMLLYVLLSAGAMAGCRLGPLRLLRAQLPFAVFASGVLMVNVLSRPGHEPWPDLPIRITEEGMVLGAALALRALVIGLGALIVARAADPRRTMVSLLQHARLPARYAYALLAGRRLLDDLPRRWETITRAHRVRLPLTAEGAVARLRARQLLRCAFSLLVDSVRSADRISFALESRGLGDGERTLWRPVRLTRADALLTLGVALVVAAVLMLS